MNDIIVEQLVEKRADARSFGIRLLAVAAGAVLTVLPLIIEMLFIPPESQGGLLALLPFTLAAGVFVIVLLFRRTDLEYEYILTNGELDIDKIMGKRKRKRMLTSVNCRSFDVLAPMIPKYEHEYGKVQLKRVDISSSQDATGRWFAVYVGDKGVRTLLVFEPNVKMLETLKKFVPRSKIMPE
jgi:hypothetical protein